MTCPFESPLWAITAYYNPAGFERRRANYRLFRQQLQVPLLAMELAGPGQHELTDADAEMVIRKTGNSAIWQKERLLNIAVRALPPHVRYVAWLDCDVAFSRNDWAHEAAQYLESQGGLLQPYEKVSHLTPHAAADSVDLSVLRNSRPLYVQQSFARAYKSDQINCQSDLDALMSPLRMEKGVQPDSIADTRPAPGFAWVAQKDDLEKLPLYEFCVIGGGDSAYAYASVGKPELHERGIMSPRHAAHYFRWAEKSYSYFGGNVGYLKGDIQHLWHGWLNDRNYVGRNRLLFEHGFDPATDIVPDHNGVWAWADPDSPLAVDLKRYFFERKEDG